MNKLKQGRDLQVILRQASLQLQDNHDLVCVASIVKRIKNWWKIWTDPEFAQKAEKFKEIYFFAKEPLSNLNKLINDIDKAFKDQDADSLEDFVKELNPSIEKVIRSLSNVSNATKNISNILPSTTIDDKGNIYEEYIQTVQKGYKSDPKIMKVLINQLPKALVDSIPIENMGKRINKKISEIPWFQKYNTNTIEFSDEVKNRLKNKIKEIILNKFKLDENQVNDLLNASFENLIQNIKTSILNKGILLTYMFPEVSTQVPNRTANQMWVSISLSDIEMNTPVGTFTFNFPDIILNDLGASVKPIDKLSIRKIETPIISDQIKKSSSLLTNIVKKYVISNILPQTRIVISSVDNTPLAYKIRFAKIIHSALKSELDADNLSIHHNNQNIEIECDIAAKTENSIKEAVNAVISGTKEAFSIAFGYEPNFEISNINACSKYELISAAIMDESYRQILFDSINGGGFVK